MRPGREPVFWILSIGDFEYYDYLTRFCGSVSRVWVFWKKRLRQEFGARVSAQDFFEAPKALSLQGCLILARLYGRNAEIVSPGLIRKVLKSSSRARHSISPLTKIKEVPSHQTAFE